MNIIAKIGENPNFIAFMAHSGVAAFLIALVPQHYLLPAMAAAAGLAAVKEFWFDLRYETTPPQTLADSALDFTGYMAGIAAGFIRVRYGL